MKTAATRARARCLALVFVGALAAGVVGCGPHAGVSPGQTAQPKAVALDGQSKVVSLDGDDRTAADVLHREFTSLGWNVKAFPDRVGFVVNDPRGGTYMLLPRMSGRGEIDRIDVAMPLVAKKDHRGSARLRELVAKLNDSVSGVHFSVDSDGDLVCESSVFFIDNLEVQLVVLHLRWMAMSVLPGVAKLTPELVGMLE
jgi:hypothetical protein